MPQEKGTRVPMYRVITDALTERIRSGAFSFDEPLCTEATLMAEFSSSRITVRRALDELEEKGFITRKRGIGCFVSRTAYETLRAEDDRESLRAHANAGVYALTLPASMGKTALQAAFDGANELLTEFDQHTALYLSGSAPEERPAALLSRYAAMDIAGVMLLCDAPDSLETELNRLLLQGKPVVLAGCKSPYAHVSSAYFDETDAAALTIAHLAALGHVNIAYYGQTGRGLSGYLLALDAQGLRIDAELICPPNDAKALRRCIDKGATAFLAQSAALAQHLARDLTALGLHIPGSVSLCCMEDCPPLPALRRGEPVRTVTHIARDHALLGRTCAQMLHQMQGRAVSPAHNEALPVRLSPGTTTAPVAERK